MKTKRNKSEDQKHNTLKPEPLEANGEFCLSIGNKTLHHLSSQQLKTFILQISGIQKHPDTFMSEENKDEEKIEIEIQKHIQWHDEEEPLCFYNINSPCGDISMASLSQLKQLSEMLRQVINPYTSQQSLPSAKNTPNNLQIWRQETPRQFPAAFYSQACIDKQITYSSSSPVPKTEYMLSANELFSNRFNGEELSCLQQELTRFMEKNQE